MEEPSVAILKLACMERKPQIGGVSRLRAHIVLNVLLNMRPEKRLQTVFSC